MNNYFDYNATSPMRPEAREAMRQALEADLGNPSSMHGAGRRARRVLDDSRHQLAEALGADPLELVFTSGATESNNLALRAVAALAPRRPLAVGASEHASVLRTSELLEQQGHARRLIPVNPSGLPDRDVVFEALRDGALLSLAAANGESGAVLPAGFLAECLTEAAQATESGRGSSIPPLVHIDAAQAFGRVTISGREQADLISVSSHKIGGPPGAGALVVRQNLRSQLPAQITGGSQEDSLRAGTENLPAIAGMAAAATAAVSAMREEQARLTGFRERLWAGLYAAWPDLLRISPPNGLPNTLTVAMPDTPAQSVIASLDLEGFSVSSGSACAAAAPEPSHVMQAMGIAPRYMGGVLRISTGWATQSGEAEDLITTIGPIFSRARSVAAN